MLTIAKKINMFKPTSSSGHEWWEQRQFVSPNLMKPLEILKHLENVDKVVSNYLERLPTGFKSKDGPIMSDDGDFVRSDLKKTLFLWSLECKAWQAKFLKLNEESD